MKTELEKRASKFIDETDTMQFTTMELLTMFAEKEQALQLLQTDVSGMLKSFVSYAESRSISDININDDTIEYFIEDFNLR